MELGASLGTGRNSSPERKPGDETTVFLLDSHIQSRRSRSYFCPREDRLDCPGGSGKNKSPIEATKASVEKGKEVYEKKCASCHGTKGDGKGPLSSGLNPKPTNFRGSHGEKMSDGEHFWKITNGRGAMPSYAKDLTEEERWHVINYINTFMKHK